MNASQDVKKLYIFAALAVATIAAVIFLVVRGNNLNTSRDPKVRVSTLMEKGVNTSQSLFTPEETEQIIGKINERKEKFLSGADATAQNLMDLARLVRDLRDFDLALKLFGVVDTMTAPDLFYKIDVARIYIERSEWEQARLVLEPLRLTLPIRETYVELAKAYQHLDGTPDYVVDQIYEEGLFRTFSDFEVLEAYVRWLEQTGREEKTIPYLEQMNQKAPQQILQDKIKALKAKYQK